MTATRGVVLHGLVDGGAGRVGVSPAAAALEGEDGPLRPDLLEGRRRVVGDGIGAGLGHAVSLGGQDVQEDGTLLVLDVGQPAAQGGQVVAVDGSEIAETQLLEEHAAGQEGLEAVLDLFEGLRGHAAHERNPTQKLANLPLGVLVEGRQPGLVEAVGESADARANGHLVVVEDDQEVLAQAASVVEGLEDDARGQGTVADDGHGMGIGPAEEIVAGLQAEAAGNGAAGVAGHERVVGALLGVGIAHEAAARADGVELGEAAGDQLMRINLMAGIPDEPVLGEVEGQVQGEAQLDDAEVTGEMSGADGKDPDQLVAHFLGQVAELAFVEPVQIGGRTNLGEQCGHGVVLSTE